MMPELLSELRSDGRVKLFYFYYNMKPHTVVTHLLAFSGGFLFSSSSYFYLPNLLPVLAGVGLVVASAGSLNNIIDRKRDRRMLRTRNRPLASGKLSLRLAVFQTIVFCTAGSMILLATTNLLAIWLGLSALVFYVAVYGILKRRFRYATLTGGVPGSLVVVSGYAASAGVIDARGFFLFLATLLLLTASYRKVILRRQTDYALAELPVLDGPARAEEPA